MVVLVIVTLMVPIFAARTVGLVVGLAIRSCRAGTVGTRALVLSMKSDDIHLCAMIARARPADTRTHLNTRRCDRLGYRRLDGTHHCRQRSRSRRASGSPVLSCQNRWHTCTGSLKEERSAQ